MSLPWTSEQAIIWLEGQSRHPDKNYLNLCAHLVSRAFGYNGAGFPSASAWARSIPKGKRRYGKAPRGALRFWETNGWGHVAVADGKGYVEALAAEHGLDLFSVVSAHSCLSHPAQGRSRVCRPAAGRNHAMRFCPQYGPAAADLYSRNQKTRKMEKTFLYFDGKNR